MTTNNAVKTWNKDSIVALIERNDRAVERAIVAIFDRQTIEEQCSEVTMNHNGVGFTAAHAKLGSYYAKWVKRGKRLSGSHLEKARAIAKKYHRQLLEIANGEA